MGQSWGTFEAVAVEAVGGSRGWVLCGAGTPFGRVGCCHSAGATPGCAGLCGGMCLGEVLGQSGGDFYFSWKVGCDVTLCLCGGYATYYLDMYYTFRERHPWFYSRIIAYVAALVLLLAGTIWSIKTLHPCQVWYMEPVVAISQP